MRILWVEQFFNQRHRRIHINVKMVKNHLAGRINDNRPGCAARTVVAHDFRDAMGPLIAGCMRHGNRQLVFKLVFTKLIFRIDGETFKNRLNAQKHDIIAAFKGLGQLFEGWKPNPLAARSPVLKEVQINDLATIVVQADGRDLMAVAINPVGQIQLRSHLALDAVTRTG